MLDLESFEYRQAKEVSFPSLDSARKEKELPAKIQALAGGEDKASAYVWKLLSETMLYSARRVPEICDDILSVDRALRWGFNWQLGPFELWDALGVRATADRLEKEGREIPALVEELLRGGSHSFYSTAGEGAKRRPSAKLGSARRLRRPCHCVATSCASTASATRGVRSSPKRIGSRGSSRWIRLSRTFRPARERLG